MDLANLCEKLIRSDAQDEVIHILSEAKLWDNPDNWKPLDNNPGNWSIVNNQSGDAVGALVELIVNSSDANLTRKCKENGINPEDPQNAPASIPEAIKQFYGLKPYALDEITPSERVKLAENVCGLVVTGSKKCPTYGIFDHGEGQRPEDFERTFLSIAKQNKVNISFVQGKFNQGSHGTLSFCGKNHLKLIVSKSFKDIANPNGKWGFTIIRRRKPRPNEKTSVAEFLVIDENVPSFIKEAINVIPGRHPKTYENPLRAGTYIKLYEYDVGPSLKTNANLQLYFSLSSYLVEPVLPFRIYERREYQSETYETTFMGILQRLRSEGAYKFIEKNFPIVGIIYSKFGELKYTIYALTTEAEKSTYGQNNGIIFSINGQKHAAQQRNFYKKKKVGLHILADSLITIIDCSKITPEKHEDLFKTSRDRMNDESEKELLDEITDILINDNKIRELKNKRHNELIENKTKDNLLGQNVMEKILRNHPAFRNFLNSKGRISQPFGKDNLIDVGEFNGKPHPTYFCLEKEFSESNPRHGQIGRKVRINFATDVVDDYLARDEYPGTFSLKIIDQSNSNESLKYRINGSDGRWTLSLNFPDDIQIDSTIKLETSITDDTLLKPFKNEFFVRFGNKFPTNEKVKNPSNPNPKMNNLAPPPPYPVHKDEWQKYDMDEKTALKVIHKEGDDWEYFYNADNIFLKTEQKNSASDSKIIEQQFALGLQFLCMSYIANSSDEEIEKTVREFSAGAAPAIVTIIQGLSNINNYIADYD